MKLLTADIYGFGKWKEESFSFSDYEVNVFSGKNEAGKSTIHQFLLFILFGLPPKRREFFRPKTGGTIGGRLRLLTPDFGEITIERVHDKRNGEALCRLADGEEHGEEWLKALWKGLNREGYEAIFSFTAGDLTRIRHLSGDELSEVLLNIGLTGSDQIYQTEKWLNKQLEDRFKPKGKIPSINKQLNVVNELDQKLKAAKYESEQYEDFQVEKESLAQSISDIENSLKKVEKEAYSYEQLMKVWPVLMEFHQVKEELAPVGTFPEQGRERYQQLKEAILPFESEKHSAASMIEQLEQKQIELSDILVSSDRINDAKELLDQEQTYHRHVHEYEQSDRRLELLREHIHSDMEQLNLPMEPSELIEFSFPFYIEDTWRSIKEDAKKADADEEQLKNRLQEIENEKRRILERKDTIDQELLGEKEIATLREKAENPSSHSRFSLLHATAVVVLIFGWGIGIFLSEYGYGWFATLVTLLLFFAGFIDQRQKEVAPVESQQEREELRHLLQKNEELKAEWRQLQEREKFVAQEELQFDEAKRHLNQRTHRLESSIQEQESLYPFLSAFPIDHWDKLYHILTQLKEKQTEYEQLLQTREQAGLRAAELKRKVEQHLASDSERTENAWSALQKWVSEKERAYEKWASSQEDLDEQKQRHYKLEKQLEVLERKREELFFQANVENEEQFYQRLTKFEYAKDQKEKSQQLALQLKTMLSDEEQRMFNIWEEAPQESLRRREAAEVQEKRKHLRETLHEKQQMLADLKSEINQLESSESYSNALHRMESERSALQEQAEEWAAYQVAYKLLHQTKSLYKDQHLPKVIATADTYFQRLTKGQYRKILLSADQDRMKVESRLHEWYDIDELSRGTRDQLYVSLRLALGDTMAETVPMPFLMDDAFVHFDEERLEEMLLLLEELATKHQMVLFTWRESMTDYFRSASFRKLS
ncbi:hypothetical protein EQV77_11345 [Halobacillus fulvus]|nr:hypothetical protein EQV77_11345 [Halobacillus fulvus]